MKKRKRTTTLATQGLRSYLRCPCKTVDSTTLHMAGFKALYDHLTRLCVKHSQTAVFYLGKARAVSVEFAVRHVAHTPMSLILFEPADHRRQRPRCADETLNFGEGPVPASGLVHTHRDVLMSTSKARAPPAGQSTVSHERERKEKKSLSSF